MVYSLPANNLYGNKSIPISLPDTWDVNVHSYKGEKARGLRYEEIYQNIAAPQNMKPISEDAVGCNDAVIIIDDITRPTPLADVAAAVISQLEQAGVPRGNIRFVVALGMHRAMGREEFVRKLGEDIVREFYIYNHNPFFNNVRVGVSSSGIPIELNADCVAADYKVGIGSIFPHPNTGISGGGKLIVPGIASTETIRRYHLQPASRWNLNTNGRKITLDSVDLLGLNCKIDALLNGNGEIAVLYTGNCRDNIESNYKEICAFYQVDRPNPADLVIANNYFKPSEAGIACCYPEFFSLIKPGGDLVIAANSPNGAAAHYLFGKWGNSIGGLAYSGESRIPPGIGRYFAFTQLLDKASSLQYHFDPSDPRFHWARDWNSIIDTLGDQPRSVLILPYATIPYFVPALDEKSDPVLTIGYDRYKPI